MNKGEEKRKITNIDNTRVIQERIVTGKGMGEFYIEVNFEFRDYPFWKIESSSTTVDVYKTIIIADNKVLFNSWVYKSVVYETIDSGLGLIDEKGIVTLNGELKHKTKRIPLNGIININPINDNIISNKDLVKIINAYVSAEIEEEEIEEPIRNKMINYRFYNRVRYSYEEQKNNNINIFEISSKPMKSYRKLNVNMIIKIEVKTVRTEEIPINI